MDPSNPGPWPLYIPSRTLAVFAHVFMGKLQTDGGITDIKTVWMKFFETLLERCLDGPALEEKGTGHLLQCYATHGSGNTKWSPKK